MTCIRFCIQFQFSCFEAVRWKKSAFNILQQVFLSPSQKPRGAQNIVFSFSLLFFLRIFLTLDTFSFKFDWAVIMALTSSLERRGVMPLRSNASGTLQVCWQGLFPRLWSDDLLQRVNVCSARKFLQPWLRALGLLPALWIRVLSISMED